MKNGTKKTMQAVRDFDKEIKSTPQLIFLKHCKCGNEMGLTLAVEDNGYELRVTERKDYSHTCYMIGNSTVQCAGCSKRSRSNHKAIVETLMVRI